MSGIRQCSLHVELLIKKVWGKHYRPNITSDHQADNSNVLLPMKSDIIPLPIGPWQIEGTSCLTKRSYRNWSSPLCIYLYICILQPLTLNYAVFCRFLLRSALEIEACWVFILIVCSFCFILFVFVFETVMVFM